MSSCGWMWVYVGCALMFLELIAPGFVIFFFGLAAASVGVIRSLVGESFTVAWQFGVFSALSLLYIVLLRRLLKKVFVGGKIETKGDFDHESVGRVGRVTETIDPPRSGRIMLGDAEWTAVSEVRLEVGADVMVVGQNNLTMRVKPL